MQGNFLAKKKKTHYMMPPFTFYSPFLSLLRIFSSFCFSSSLLSPYPAFSLSPHILPSPFLPSPLTCRESIHSAVNEQERDFIQLRDKAIEATTELQDATDADIASGHRPGFKFVIDQGGQRRRGGGGVNEKRWGGKRKETEG